jgi:hypothetical protein
VISYWLMRSEGKRLAEALEICRQKSQLLKVKEADLTLLREAEMAIFGANSI